MAMGSRESLFVSMNGLRVGTVARISRRGLEFRYESEWLEEQAAIPLSLSLPLATTPRTDQAVLHFFDNLLPDDPAVRESLRRSTGAESADPFDLLSAVGGDCVGSLQLHSDPKPPNVRLIEGEAWDNATIAEHLRGISAGSVRPSAEAPFRISLAGAQRKSALLWHDGCWQRPIGPTPTTHILKLPIGRTPDGVDLSTSVDNEHVCALLTRAFGLEVARTEIVQFEDQRVLSVQRFDRRLAPDGSWWTRLPQEDLCQATGTSGLNKYENDGGPGIEPIMSLLGASDRPDADREAFFQAQVLFWLMAAIDGHAKNFSLFLGAGGRYRLAPLYDVMSAHPALESKHLRPQEIRMAMAVRGKNRHYDWQRMRRRHFVETARRSGVPAERAQELIDQLVERAPSAVDAVAADPRSESADPAIRDAILAGVGRAAERLGNQSDEG